jgi:phosphatidylglycerophosphate synthase
VEFKILPPPDGVPPRLLGLDLVERARRMLVAAGLTEDTGQGDLVIYPSEVTGPAGVGKEIAQARPPEGGVLALTVGTARPILVVSASARTNESDSLEPTQRRSLSAPAMELRPDNVRAVKKFMLRCLRKPVDGLISRSVNRPISLAMSSLFVETSLTPNQLTAMTFGVALVAAALMTQGWFFLGACVMQLSSILDGCDGEVARLKYQSSRLGGWLDTILDDVSNQLFLLATAWGVYHATGGLLRTLVLCAAIGAFVFGGLSLFFVYRRLIQSGNSDAAGLTWGATPGTSPLRRFLGTYLANAVKRDFYYFLFLPITAVGHAELIVFGAFFAAMGAAITIVRESTTGQLASSRRTG